SLALKGSGRINEQTRNKIQQLAKELHYIPNSIARSLVQKKSQTVGFLVPRITSSIQIEAAQMIERKLIANGYNMILMTTDNNPEYESYALDILLSRQVDGIFLYPIKIHNAEKIRSIREANHPIILLSGGEYDPPSDAVYMNRFLGAYKAASYLSRLGHRKIAFICAGFVNDNEKLKGYKAGLEDNGLIYKPELVKSVNELTYEQGYLSAADLFQQEKPTAILAAGDYLALGALRWCREQGLRVPDDVAIVGFDDLEAARYAEVSLTSVTYNFSEITNCATDLLFSMMEAEGNLTSLKPKRIEIEPHLVIRDSCGYKKGGLKTD
ncbi:MAG: LacI family transcriptional regulator, partial [Bacilli bacterium]|nr:LacI family transcriptional regulator [Bacilli bacterium]